MKRKRLQINREYCPDEGCEYTAANEKESERKCEAEYTQKGFSEDDDIVSSVERDILIENCKNSKIVEYQTTDEATIQEMEADCTEEIDKELKEITDLGSSTFNIGDGGHGEANLWINIISILISFIGFIISFATGWAMSPSSYTALPAYVAAFVAIGFLIHYHYTVSKRLKDNLIKKELINESMVQVQGVEMEIMIYEEQALPAAVTVRDAFLVAAGIMIIAAITAGIEAIYCGTPWGWGTPFCIASLVKNDPKPINNFKDIFQNFLIN